MENTPKNIVVPLWWQYSKNSWHQLIGVFDSLNIAELETVTQQENWTAVSGGVTNFNYRLCFLDQQFFIQILDGEKLQRLPSQQFVPSNHVMEKNHDLKRWLIHCFYESKEVRVFDWTEAKNTSNQILLENSLELELVDFLATLHTNISVLPILDINQHLDHYFHLAMKRNPDNKHLFEVSYNRAKHCAKSFVPSKNCHNDLSPGNVLFLASTSRAQLIVVDWEYACISDPVFDLAGISINFGFNQAQEERLIQIYSEKMEVYSSLKKYNELKELYRLTSQLWCA